MKSAVFVKAGLLLAFVLIVSLLWYTETSGKILYEFQNSHGSLFPLGTETQWGQRSNAELLSRVQDRILTCLDTTGMKDYYQREGLLNTSLTAAASYIRGLHELIPESFLTQSPNHCWSTNVVLHLKKDGDWFEASGKGFFNESMVCLPQVFLAGFGKCGSSNLYHLVCQHPMLVRPQIKEPHWWEKGKFHTTSISQNGLFLTQYLLTYKPLVTEMQTTSNFNLLTIDGTPGTMCPRLELGGEFSRVNYCLLPAVHPEILPRAKYIVVMRKPTDMVYSDFWYTCAQSGHQVPESVQLKVPTIFHERVATKIKQFKLCIKHFPLVKCAQSVIEDNFTSELPCGRTPLERGLYYIHVHKWLSVVPRSKFCYLTLEELSADSNSTMAKVWQFLGLPHVTLDPKNRSQQTTFDYRHDPRLAMREDTREMLDDFFAPYNQMLADLLNDNRFLWTT